MTDTSAGETILAIDVGTQSVRALLFDGRGELVGSARVPIEPFVSPQLGWAEQDPELYWESIVEACRRLWAASGSRQAPSVAALSVTTQRGSVVCLDAAGRPLRPAILWLDQRRVAGLPPIGGPTGLAFRLLGVGSTVAAFQADAEVNWIWRNEPDVWRRTAHYLLLSGFVIHRLTGRYIDSSAAQVGYLPFDYKRQQWAAAGDWKWRVAPIDRSQLPDLEPPTATLGSLEATAAEALGLRVGLPVIASAADKACEVLGSGATDPAIGAISFGTAATFNVNLGRYREVVPLVPPFPSAIPGGYNLETTVHRGFWLVEWFKREFGQAESRRAEELGIPTEAVFDELLAGVPPGSMGLTLQPTWMPGVRIPGPEAKGAIVGFGDVHTRAHVYRAILEGIAYALREGAERTERRTGVRLRELRVSGGGSRSPAAVQLTADVFGLPSSHVHTHETSGLGAAVDAAVGLGWYPGVAAAARGMVRVNRTHEPDAAAHRVYEELFRRVYRRLYGALRPLYEEIQSITGYPPAV